VLLSKATQLVNYFLHFHLEKILPVRFRPEDFHLRRGAFLGEPQPLVNCFLYQLSKNFRRPFARSRVHLRRGAFLGEPGPFVNSFLIQLSKNFAARF